MLQTKHLLIRPARLEDADALFEVYGDAQTMRYWDSLPDKALTDTETRVRGFLQAHSYFVIEHEGQAIGTAGVHHGTEIGYILHRGHWRQGLMREALMALIPWLFDTLPITELTADVDPDNAGSVALLKSLGFRQTGRAKNTIEVDGVWYDSLYLALAGDDFAR